jgi:acetoacetyl-CoA synthetase
MTITMSTDEDLLWQPAHPEQAQATLFRKHVADKYGVPLESYEDLLKWTFANSGEFWSEVWDWEGVVGEKGAGPVSRRLQIAD